MSFSTFTKILSLITLFLCFSAVLGRTYRCIGYEKFSINDPFRVNLFQLVSYLSFETPPSGFSIGTKGVGKDKVYGLALCSPYVNVNECSSCLNSAIDAALESCAFNKGGAMWFENCQVKYSNKDFLSRIDDRNLFYSAGKEIASNPASFDQKAAEYLRQLAEQASKEPIVAAMSRIQLEGTEQLEGLAQCTRDLSRAACKTCLDKSITGILSCCPGRENIRFYSATCDIRHRVLK